MSICWVKSNGLKIHPSKRRRQQQRRRIPRVNQLRQLPLGPAGRQAGGWVVSSGCVRTTWSCGSDDGRRAVVGDGGTQPDRGERVPAAVGETGATVSDVRTSCVGREGARRVTYARKAGGGLKVPLLWPVWGEKTSFRTKSEMSDKLWLRRHGKYGRGLGSRGEEK